MSLDLSKHQTPKKWESAGLLCESEGDLVPQEETSQSSSSLSHWGPDRAGSEHTLTELLSCAHQCLNTDLTSGLSLMDLRGGWISLALFPICSHWVSPFPDFPLLIWLFTGSWKMSGWTWLGAQIVIPKCNYTATLEQFGCFLTRWTCYITQQHKTIQNTFLWLM